jgi:hypothetical protein
MSWKQTRFEGMSMKDLNTRTTAMHTLQALPAGAFLNSVEAETVNLAGRQAIRVQLTAAAASGVPGVDYVDQPTFVQIPADFGNGVIEVDVLSRLTEDAPDYARAFAGLAYRIAEGLESFEAVYVWPLNGERRILRDPERSVQSSISRIRAGTSSAFARSIRTVVSSRGQTSAPTSGSTCALRSRTENCAPVSMGSKSWISLKPRDGQPEAESGFLLTLVRRRSSPTSRSLQGEKAVGSDGRRETNALTKAVGGGSPCEHLDCETLELHPLRGRRCS